MKIGSAVMFMFLSLVALGYLLSDNFNVRQDLAQAQLQYNEIHQEMTLLLAERDALVKALAESEQKNQDLTQTIQAQQDQINRLDYENTSLENENSSLLNQVKALKAIQTLRDFPLIWAVMFPLIPVSLATSYGVVVYSKRLKDQRTRKGQPKAYVQLTQDEIKSLIQIRRSR
jgi:nitrate reductase NapE component